MLFLVCVDLWNLPDCLTRARLIAILAQAWAIQTIQKFNIIEAYLRKYRVYSAFQIFEHTDNGFSIFLFVLENSVKPHEDLVPEYLFGFNPIFSWSFWPMDLFFVSLLVFFVLQCMPWYGCLTWFAPFSNSLWRYCYFSALGFDCFYLHSLFCTTTNCCRNGDILSNYLLCCIHSMLSIRVKKWLRNAMKLRKQLRKPM